MRVEDKLTEMMSTVSDSRVREAMLYSLMAGGKRIRPNMLYATAHGYGLCDEDVDAFACALEMIHTYSLIHDDLPAMDNDDLRRGKPTCHKQFDEATAILAGDGLLTYAFETAASSPVNPSYVVKAIGVLAQMAGPSGMVLGQCLDTEEGESSVDWDALMNIHAHKTGCLLSAALMIPAVLAGCDTETVEQWHTIGDMIGLAFQIQDDILDVTLTAEEFGKSNSDVRNEKVTSVTLLGLEEAEKRMQQLYQESMQRIEAFKGFDSKELRGLIEETAVRRK